MGDNEIPRMMLDFGAGITHGSVELEDALVTRSTRGGCSAGCLPGAAVWRRVPRIAGPTHLLWHLLDHYPTQQMIGSASPDRLLALARRRRRPAARPRGRWSRRSAPGL
eukprot:1178369-Prymnesium_polylepis.1